MKAPSDALVEWRCKACAAEGGARLFGYVRRVGGRLTYTTMRASHEDGPAWVVAQDTVLSVAEDGVTVCCGRHHGWVSAADMKPAGIRRRKVIVESTGNVVGPRSFKPPMQGPMERVRRSGSLD